MKLDRVLLVLVLAFTVTVDAKIQVCYWFAQIGAGSIDPYICTHIIYSFIGLDIYGGLNYLDRSAVEAENLIIQMVHLKQQNPSLKVLAAVGGGDDALVPIWTQMAANPAARENFARNIYNFVVTHSLDGIDIDWEHPNFSGDTPHDVENYNQLLRTLKDHLGSRYSLSTAIGAGPWRTNLSYDIPAIFSICDFVNVMAYDMHGSWEPFTGIHAPLFSSTLDPTPANVHDSVNLLLSKGAWREKLIVGMPAYGIAFTLNNPDNNGVGAPATGAGALKYRDICNRINAGTLNYRWEEQQMVPYAFSGTFWIGYDNARSVTEKSHYINNNNLGGSMFWAVDSDDYDNSCGAGTYPLIRTAHSIVVGWGRDGFVETNKLE